MNWWRAHSTAILLGVAEHFGIALPADATGVRFSADFNPMFGEYNLQLRFETTPAGLRTLTTTSGFTTPTPVDASAAPAPADCPGPLISHQLRMSKSDTRTLVVDTTNPSRPQVYLEAYDL